MHSIDADVYACSMDATRKNFRARAAAESRSSDRDSTSQARSESPAAGAASGPSIAAAQAALRDGNLEHAAQLLGQLADRAPDHANHLLLTGILAWKRKEFATAASRFQWLAESHPGSASAHHWLGNALHSLGRFDDAKRAYAAALRIGRDSDSRSNLEMAERDCRKRDLARACIDASRTQGSAAHLRTAIDIAFEFARRGLNPPHTSTVPVARHRATISFVTCSITPPKLARLEASLRATIDARTRWQLIGIPDATSLCEGFTRGFQKASGDIIVFCHDDIEILCDRFDDRLVDALDGADVVGVVGVTRLEGPALAWTAQRHLHGAVTHAGKSGAFHPGIGSAYGPRIDGAIALDGLFIATRPDVVRRIGFDTGTFDGWHFYDLDFSYRAHRAGYRLRIQTDIHLLHASKGNFDAEYTRYSRRFAAKHGEFANPPPFVAPQIHEIRTRSRDEALRTRAWLDAWIRDAAASSPSSPARE